MIKQALKKFSHKTGLPPGTLIHTGETIAAQPNVHATFYNDLDLFSEEITESYGEIPRGVAGKVTWINVDGVHRPEIVRKIGERFGIHPLVLEDVVHTGQRPKLEEYEDYIYFTLRVMLPSPIDDAPATESQLSIILCEHAVLTFNEFGINIFESILKRIANAKGKIRTKAEDFLVYTIFDTVVDNYFLVLENFGERIEALEDEIFSLPDNKTLESIHNLKRELSVMRRAVWPLREVINQLLRDELPYIQESSYKYFRDVYDHSIQIIETLETMRDTVAGLFDIHLSSTSHRMNQVMKVLTVIATIFIPLTFIAGVYGMNFQYMPELTWRWGYYAILGVMAILGLGMAIYFKIKDWF
jgi:magnesium transporter